MHWLALNTRLRSNAYHDAACIYVTALTCAVTATLLPHFSCLYICTQTIVIYSKTLCALWCGPFAFRNFQHWPTGLLLFERRARILPFSILACQHAVGH